MFLKFRVFDAAIGFAAMLALAPVGLKADTITYVYTSGGVFGTLDLSTGAYSAVGSSSSLQTAGTGGFAETGGVLYAGGFSNPNSGLYTVSTSGVAAVVGSTQVSTNGYVFGGTTGGGLYSVGQSGYLYSVSTAGVFTTATSAIGLPGFGGYVALSNNGTSLFLEDDGTLWSIATGTGVGTEVDNGSVGHDYTALIFEGSTLYGLYGSEIYSVNTSNGQDTAVQAITGLSSSNIVAIAPDPITGMGSSTPEPGTWVLLGAGMSAFVLFRRRARAIRT